MNLDLHQIHLIQSSFERVLPQFDLTAEQFYARLFELEPGFVTLFREDRRVQGRKLMKMILMVVNSLQDFNTLRGQLLALGQRHINYGVMPDYFPTMGQALIDTLAARVGPTFDDETRQAWEQLFALVAETTIEGMAS